MVTAPEAVEPDAPRVTIERAARVVVAGHVQGAVRRILLYVAVGVALMVPQHDGLSVAVGVVGLAALILLALTDNLA